MRELRGYRIPTREDPRNSTQTSTFMVLDSHYCYDVVFQIESADGWNGLTPLRARVADFCDRLNTGPFVCACKGCENELPIEFARPGRRRIYCGSLCQWRQKSRNLYAAKKAAA